MKLSTLPRDFHVPRPGEMVVTPEHAAALLLWDKLRKVPKVRPRR